MRILLDYRPALRHRTGVGEFVHELTRALADNGTDDVTILTSSWKDRPEPALSTELPHVRIVDRRIPVRSLTWAWNRLGWPPAEWLAGRVDVVHAQSPLLIPARYAAQVVTIHDLDFLRHPERAEAEMRRDFPTLVHEHVRRADHLVVSSHYAAREVTARFGLPANRVTVCSPGAPAWALDIARARERLGSAGSIILFLGTLEPRKNLGTLLDAYGLMRARRADVPRLVLAGGQRPSIRRELDRLAGPPFAGYVSAPGYVSEADRQRLYRDARMLVLPSLEEGFGLPVLEAMACGVPVVISNRGSLPEVAGDAARPVDPSSAEALAAEMERLLDPPAAAAALARGFDRAARYSWAACARAAREAYAAAAARREERA